ncbi:hypothetical protein [Planococcus faecalis]|nr:hypothetical protein [Planococcus faecalis]
MHRLKRFMHIWRQEVKWDIGKLQVAQEPDSHIDRMYHPFQDDL